MVDVILTTDATLPTGTSASVVIENDSGNNGSFDDSAVQSIDNGTNTYTLSLSSNVGDAVRVTPKLSNNDVTAGASVNSIEVTLGKPDAPSSLSVSQGSEGQLDLSWTDNSGTEDGFYVYRSTSSGSSTSDYTQVANLSSNTTTYTDTGLSDGEKYYYRVSAYSSGGESSLSNEGNAVTVLPAPTGTSATVDSSQQITVSWTDQIDNGNYDIQMLRDGTSWVTPAGGDAYVGHNTTSVSYGPNSDYSYNQQVGIDSEFRFRVRSTTSHATSGWDYSGTVYTHPIPPHNPSVSRPDANTFDITWENQSDIANINKVRVREDTGSGYGSWANFRNVNGSDTSTTIQVGDVGTWDPLEIKEDARYQFHLVTQSSQGDLKTSQRVYTDYGNNGNVYFADDFEDQDFTEWRATSGATIESGTGGSNANNTGVSGASDGTYYAAFDGEGYIEASLGDMSGENDVHIRCSLATGSMDNSLEYTGIEFYDGSNWNTLARHSWEYNEQGFVTVHADVPDSYLSTDNYFRIIGNGGLGGGDQHAVDDVIVSDVLHEYTKPSAPSSLSLDTSVEDEITATWTDNASVGKDQLRYRVNGTSNWNYQPSGGGDAGGSTTLTNLPDGEQYEANARAYVRQNRHGSFEDYYTTDGTIKTDTTLLPAPTNFDATATNSDGSIDLSWTDNSDNEDSFDVYLKKSSNTSYTLNGSLAANTTTYTTTSLATDTTYDLKVKSVTEHTTAESSVISQDTVKVRNVSGDAVATGTVTRTFTLAPRNTAGSSVTNGTVTRTLTLPRNVADSVTTSGSVVRTFTLAPRTVTGTAVTDGTVTRTLTFPRNIVGSSSTAASVSRVLSLIRSVNADIVTSSTVRTAIHEVLSNGLRQHDVFFDADRLVFHTEWFEETPTRDVEETSVPVLVGDYIGDIPIQLRIEVRDENGTVNSQASSSWTEVADEDAITVLDDVDVENENIRIALRDLRLDDDIRAVETATTSR